MAPREGTARIVELLLGLATILVVYLLGRRINCAPAGLIAALGVAVYPPFIHSTGALYSEPPAMLTLPAGDPHLPLGERHRAASGGGLAVLVPGLPVRSDRADPPRVPPRRRSPSSCSRRFASGRSAAGARGRSSRAPLLLAVAIVIPIVPWTIHNIISLDRAVPISTGGGKALYVGTLLPADGEYQRVKALLVKRYLGRDLEPGSEALDDVEPAPLFDRVAARYPDLPRDEALGKIGKEDFYDYIDEDPSGYAAMTVRKVWRMWSGGVGEAMSATAGRVIQVLIVALALGGLGVLAGRRRWWEFVVMATPIVLVTLVGAATLAASRRNEVLMTLVFPLAGVTLAWAGAALSSSGPWSRRTSSPQS